MIEGISGFALSDLWNPKTLVVGATLAVLSGGGILWNRVETIGQAVGISDFAAKKSDP